MSDAPPDAPMPRLDLAPKLKRPLSLWNPLDYLRLLYWVFYFPQALRWYVDTFRGDYIPKGEMNTRQIWQILLTNPIQRNLLIQGVILTLSTTPLFCLFLEQMGFEIAWIGMFSGMLVGLTFSVALGAVRGVVVAMAFGVVFGVVVAMGGMVDMSGSYQAICAVFIIGFTLTTSVLFSLQLKVEEMVLGVLIIGGFGFPVGLVVSLSGGVALSMSEGVAFGVVLGVAFGVVSGMAIDMNVKSVLGVAFGIAVGMAECVLFGIGFGIGVSGSGMVDVAIGVSFGVAFGIAFSAAFGHLDSYIVGYFVNRYRLQNGSWLFPRITPVPLLFLQTKLQNCLVYDWELGLHNVNEVLHYSFQFIPAVNALHNALQTVSNEHLINRTAQVTREIFDWQLIYSLTTSLDTEFRVASTELSVRLIRILTYGIISRENSSAVNTLSRLDTFPHATAAGFWYLHERQPHQSVEAFAVVRSIPHGEEMYQLASSLSVCQSLCQPEPIQTVEALVKFNSLPSLQFQAKAKQGNALLRPTTWDAINAFHHIIEDTQLVHQSIAKTTRSLALNRAIGELTQVIQTKEQLPDAERELVVEIAQTWKTALEPLSLEIGQANITEPLRNPYIIGDPVLGNSFAGRDDIMRQLEELWITGETLQSIVLYGHRRMGKTSILRNAANCLGSQTQVIYINLQRLGDVENGVGEVLLALSDEIS
ncbi:MAG: ATP-binding protein, partial [Cyanobacteria bacterium P01_F01_bin.53]